MDIRTIANNATEVARKYMREQARGIIAERERIKRLAEIRDDVEYRAVVDD